MALEKSLPPQVEERIAGLLCKPKRFPIIDSCCDSWMGTRAGCFCIGTTEAIGAGVCYDAHARMRLYSGLDDICASDKSHTFFFAMSALLYWSINR